MKKNSWNEATSIVGRFEPQIQHRSGLRKSLKGKGQEFPTRPANFVAQREFEDLSIHFPEGTIINLRYRREKSKDRSPVLGEDRYCLTDIRIDLEFVGLEPEAIRAIEQEFVALPAPQHPRRK